jgi:small membrane protein
MWIQLILVVGVVLIGLFLTKASATDSHLALRRLALFGLLVAAIVLILVPRWLTWIAHAVGIGRGTDLLLYAFVLAFLVYVTSEYKRSVRINRTMTSLARELTLAQARTEDALRALSDARRNPMQNPDDDAGTPPV